MLAYSVENDIRQPADRSEAAGLEELLTEGSFFAEV